MERKLGHGNHENRGFKASLQLFTDAYESLPYFTDIFDEESFYIFAALFVLASVLVAFILSRYITIKEVEW